MRHYVRHTLSQVLLENWRNQHAEFDEKDLLSRLEQVFTKIRRHDLAHSIKLSRKSYLKSKNK